MIAEVIGLTILGIFLFIVGFLGISSFLEEEAEIESPTREVLAFWWPVWLVPALIFFGASKAIRFHVDFIKSVSSKRDKPVKKEIPKAKARER